MAACQAMRTDQSMLVRRMYVGHAVQVLGILQQVERGCTPKRNILQVYLDYI